MLPRKLYNLLLNDLKHAPVGQLTSKTNEFMERLFEHDK